MLSKSLSECSKTLPHKGITIQLLETSPWRLPYIILKLRGSSIHSASHPASCSGRPWEPTGASVSTYLSAIHMGHPDEFLDSWRSLQGWTMQIKDLSFFLSILSPTIPYHFKWLLSVSSNLLFLLVLKKENYKTCKAAQKVWIPHLWSTNTTKYCQEVL